MPPKGKAGASRKSRSLAPWSSPGSRDDDTVPHGYGTPKYDASHCFARWLSAIRVSASTSFEREARTHSVVFTPGTRTLAHGPAANANRYVGIGRVGRKAC